MRWFHPSTFFNFWLVYSNTTAEIEMNLKLYIHQGLYQHQNVYQLVFGGCFKALQKAGQKES